MQLVELNRSQPVFGVDYNDNPEVVRPTAINQPITPKQRFKYLKRRIKAAQKWVVSHVYKLMICRAMRLLVFGSLAYSLFKADNESVYLLGFSVMYIIVNELHIVEQTRTRFMQITQRFAHLTRNGRLLRLRE